MCGSRKIETVHCKVFFVTYSLLSQMSPSQLICGKVNREELRKMAQENCHSTIFTPWFPVKGKHWKIKKCLFSSSPPSLFHTKMFQQYVVCLQRHVDKSSIIFQASFITNGFNNHSKTMKSLLNRWREYALKRREKLTPNKINLERRWDISRVW